MIGEQFKQEGNDFMKQREYRKAVKCYSKAIVADPNNAIFFFNRSTAFLLLRDWKNSLDDSKRCVELDINYVKAYHRMSVAQENLNQHKEALRNISYGLAMWQRSKGETFKIVVSAEAILKLEVKYGNDKSFMLLKKQYFRLLRLREKECIHEKCGNFNSPQEERVMKDLELEGHTLDTNKLESEIMKRLIDDLEPYFQRKKSFDHWFLKLISVEEMIKYCDRAVETKELFNAPPIEQEEAEIINSFFRMILLENREKFVKYITSYQHIKSCFHQNFNIVEKINNYEDLVNNHPEHVEKLVPVFDMYLQMTKFKEQKLGNFKHYSFMRQWRFYFIYLSQMLIRNLIVLFYQKEQSLDPQEQQKQDFQFIEKLSERMSEDSLRNNGRGIILFHNCKIHRCPKLDDLSFTFNKKNPRESSSIVTDLENIMNKIINENIFEEQKKMIFRWSWLSPIQYSIQKSPEKVKKIFHIINKRILEDDRSFNEGCKIYANIFSSVRRKGEYRFCKSQLQYLIKSLRKHKKQVINAIKNSDEFRGKSFVPFINHQTDLSSNNENFNDHILRLLSNMCLVNQNSAPYLTFILPCLSRLLKKEGEKFEKSSFYSSSPSKKKISSGQLQISFETIRLVAILCSCPSVAMECMKWRFPLYLAKLDVVRVFDVKEEYVPEFEIFFGVKDTRRIQKISWLAQTGRDHLIQSCEKFRDNNLIVDDQAIPHHLQLEGPEARPRPFTFRSIPALPQFMMNIWKECMIGGNKNFTGYLLQKRNLLGAVAPRGHVTAHRVFEMYDGVRFLLLVSIGLHTSRLRDLYLAPNIERNGECGEEYTVRSFIYSCDLIAERDFNFRFKSYAFISDQFLVDIVEIAIKNTSRKLTEDESVALDFFRMKFSHCSRSNHKLHNSIQDFFRSKMNSQRKKTKKWNKKTEKKDEVSVDLRSCDEYYNFRNFRQIIRSPICRCWFFSWGELINFGFFPPHTNDYRLLDNCYESLRIPLSRATISYIIHATDVMIEWEYLIEFLKSLFTYTSVLLFQQKRYGLSEAFARSVDEVNLAQQKKIKLIDIPLVCAFLERSVVLSSDQLRNARSPQFLRSFYQKHGLEALVDLLFQKGGDNIGFSNCPRPQWKLDFLAFFSSYIKRKEKEVVFAPEVTMMILDISKYVSENKHEYDSVALMKFISQIMIFVHGEILVKEWGKLIIKNNNPLCRNEEDEINNELLKKKGVRKNLKSSVKKNCNFCGSVGTKKCGGCKKVFYCSTKCQKLDWKSHKRKCKRKR